MSEVKIEQYDSWLGDDGPAALVFCRTLLSVEGKDAWIFPPTFAQSESADDEEEGSGGDYQIDDLPNDPRRNVCLIDSVGSQANRMEPVFKQGRYAALVPQQVVKMKNGDTVNLLDAGHRAADAAVRFSKNLGPQLWAAFDDVKKKRDCSALAKLAPTSLVFGVWDSRATGVKIQRIVRSTIRAYDVTKAKRSATYQPVYDYTGNGMISLDHDKGSGKNNPLSQEGFKYSLATKTHGGVLVRDEIRQEAIINLVALRTLTADMKLKRYLLGLALVALSYRDQQCFNLREGCLLRAASTGDYDGKWKSVNFDGTDALEVIDHNIAHRQFSFLPMPSIGHAHADPSVRRVMIAAPLGDERLLGDLAMRLSGQRLRPTPETKVDHPPTLVRVSGDRVARFYIQPANAWASVTPVILPGHDDHKPDKTRKLIETALAQSGIEQRCEFEWGAFSRFPKSLSAHKYGRDKRPTGYIRPGHLLSQTAVHLKLHFIDGLEVPGPLVIGAGRHCGFGLMAGIDR